jgi:hypothetical protein
MRDDLPPSYYQAILCPGCGLEGDTRGLRISPDNPDHRVITLECAERDCRRFRRRWHIVLDRASNVTYHTHTPYTPKEAPDGPEWS